MITKWLTLAVAGAIGTIARAEMAAFVQKSAGAGFPWGIVAVNLAGSFLFGLVWAATETASRAADIRLMALTGFMGAFTTFSTLMFDTEQLFEASRPGAAAGNLVLQCGAGLLFIALGLAHGKALAS